MAVSTSKSVPTIEQEAVIVATMAGYNVRVMAVPGAGKTFTLEKLAAKLRAIKKRVLCLTYSSTLKNEWRDKNPDYRTDIHSFHSLACKLYPGLPTYDDVRLKKLLNNPPTETYRPVAYDVILIDETQDMCSLHYKLLTHHYIACQLVVVGQIRQCVFEYKTDEETRADTCYLDRPWETMKILAAVVEWKTLRLTTSFRLTQITACFINRMFDLSSDDVIQGHRPGTLPVQYYCMNIWNHAQVADIVATYITTFGPEHVQLIAPFREKVDESDSTPATKIINYCSGKHKLFFLAKEDRGRGTRRYTMPGCKGTEAKCVIIIGADMFATHVTDNQRMVACSRAIDQLVLIQSHTTKPWGTHRLEQIKAFGTVDVHVLEKPDPRVGMLPLPTSANVTVLCEGRPLSPMDAALFVCHREPHEDPHKYEAYPTLSADYQPCVSALYGDTTTFLAEQWYNKHPPLAYLNIFNPIPIGNSIKDFAKHLLASKAVADDLELYNHLDLFVWHVNEHRGSRKTVASREWLLKYGLSQDTLGAREYICALQAFLDNTYPSIRDRLTPMADYETQFPPDRLTDLRRRIPPEFDGLPWTPIQAFEAVLSAKAFNASQISLNQMQNIEAWVDGPVLVCAAENIIRVLPSTGMVRFEYRCEVKFENPVAYDKGFRKCRGIVGIMDAFDAATSTVYEFKFGTGRLQDGHKKQLLIYMYLLVSSGHIKQHGMVRGILFNSHTEEEWHTEISSDQMVSDAYLCRLVLEELRTDLIPVIGYSNGPPH
jgi:hypothetical protein